MEKVIIMEDNNSTPASSDAPSTEAATNESPAQTQVSPEQAAPVAERRKYTYKVDGKEVSEELTDDDVKKHLSMSKAAYKRMSEAAESKKQSEQLIRMLRENPEAVFENEQIMGNKKFRDIAEAYLAKQLESEMLTPEQRQQKQMQSELEKYRESERKQKEAQESQQMEQLQQHYAQEFEKNIIKGLSSQNLPKTPTTVKRMAQLMAKNLEHGLDLPPEAIAELVRQDYVRDIQELFGSTEADALLSLLGDGVSNKIRQADLKKLKANNPFGIRQPVQSSGSQEQSTQKMSKEEWKERLNKKV